MDWQTHKKQLLKSKAFRQALADSEDQYRIARAVIQARISKESHQKGIARKQPRLRSSKEN